MGKYKDLSGLRFGRLVAVSHAYTSEQRTAYWSCVCDCGATHTVRGSSLTAGVVRSCGCYNQECRASRVTTHGKGGTPAHKSWRHMRDRCLNPKAKQYPYYGGRGISICPEWSDFTIFYRDMGDPPVGYTLDRIDPDGNYIPTNCRWASREVQSRNQRARGNKSGHTGVYPTPSGKWVSQIRIGGGERVCGPTRETLSEAVMDRKELELTYWGEG